MTGTPLISTTTKGLSWRLRFSFSVCVGLQSGCGANRKQNNTVFDLL